MIRVKSKWLFVKGIAHTKILPGTIKKHWTWCEQKTILWLVLVLVGCELLESWEANQDPPIPTAVWEGYLGIGGRDFEVRGRMRAIYNLYIVF